MGAEKTFTPALGHKGLTPLYDLAIAGLTRENAWRSALIGIVDPQPEERILDVGCGTGSLIARLKTASPQSHVIGIDPDPEVLAKARLKAEAAGHEIEWREEFLTPELAAELGPVDKVVSSLVFHQTPVAEKRNILGAIWDALNAGGSLFIADYGLQRSVVMRALFRGTVQAIDGVEDTTPNAKGRLLDYIRDANFEDVQELRVIPTATGSISIYQGRKP